MTAAVIVLNATYEPISRTKVQRAVALVLNGTAVIEESDPLRRFRHKAGFVPYPRLIRLLKFVKVPVMYGPVTWSKSAVLKRDHYKCAYCGAHGDTVDHVVPISKGGGVRDWLNTVACCLRCNAKKNDRTPAQAGMKLRVTPYVPKRHKIQFDMNW